MAFKQNYDNAGSGNTVAQNQQAGGKKKYNFLGRLLPESLRKPKRQAIVIANEKVVKMEKAFEKILKAPSYFSPGPQAVQREMAGWDYTVQDIEEFIAGIAKYQDAKRYHARAGLFISSLVNHAKEDKITLDLGHLDVLFDFLGYKNRKDLTIIGNIGSHCFQDVETGRGHVEGDALDFFGAQQHGGSISISGDARDDAGYKKDGGSLLVNNVRNRTGEGMTGGILQINGMSGIMTGHNSKGGHIIINNRW